MLAVFHFMRKTDTATSADAFIEKTPVLLNSSMMMTHYSEAMLFSDKARKTFVQPNLEPIPILVLQVGNRVLYDRDEQTGR